MRIKIQLDGKELRAFTVAAILFGAIGAPFLALAGNVTLPNTFVNGQLADANDVNANFSALANAVNANSSDIGTLSGLQTATTTSLVSALNEIRHGAELTIPPQSAVVTGIVTFNGGAVQIRPPDGEVWSVRYLRGGVNYNVVLTDGNVGATIANSVNGISGPITIDHSLFLSCGGISGNDGNAIAFGAVRQRLQRVGIAQQIAPGVSVELRPPPGETWQIDFATFGLVPSPVATLFDGTVGAPLASHDSHSPILINNGLWLRFFNSTGGTVNVAATGYKLP